MKFDIIIRNGYLIDGTGNPRFSAEIGIKNEKINKICSKISESAEIEINARGLTISPGFIDAHSHTDTVLPLSNKAESFVRQGITTCVTGMCGNSLAPIHPDRYEEFKESLVNLLPLFRNIDLSWRTFKEYLEYLDQKGCTINLASFVGYENIRFAGGPGKENRTPTPDELDSMKNLVAEAMEAGAFGMSTGIYYAPQVFATTEELIELAKVVAKYHGIYMSHIRSEGELVIDSVKEVIEITEKSGCRAGQISHHKIAGEINWGLSSETLKLIEDANERGIPITCDSYPYNRYMTSLVTALPPWARDGKTKDILDRLKNLKLFEKIKNDCLEDQKEWESMIKADGFKNITLSMANSKNWKDHVGKSFLDILKETGLKDEWELLRQILIDEKAAPMVIVKSMNEEENKQILQSRYQMVGSDGAAVPYMPALKAIHPRFYGTFPRILGKYVREEKVLTLENAIRKMTSFPAQLLGLRDRGLLREGFYADLVIFNPMTIIDKATYDNPHQYPEGISHVLVNGVVVVEKNEQKNVLPGKILRNEM
ncbi:MAG: N-acyl-D-amino-acid deacylase family protein [Promethearchaeota archaeon]